MKKLCAVVTLALLTGGCNGGGDSAAPTAAAAGEASDVFAMPYQVRDLDNGLRVIVVPTDYPDIVSLRIPVQTGSRNEIEPGKSGFAHFFEHMMFRGTENYSSEEYLSILKQAGAQFNAFTSDDFTNYTINFTRPDLEKIIEVEADRFMNLSYEEDAFRTEALAVKGEYLKNYADPTTKAYERLRALAFDEHTYRHTTIGYLEDIERMPEQYEYSKTFFDRWYRPEKTAIILVGDLDPDETFALVERYWGDWKRGGYTADVPVEPPPDGPRHAHVAWEAETQPWILIGFRGPAFDPAAPDMPALDVIASLYFSNSSDLYRRLVIEEQSVDQLLTFFPNRKDPSILLVYARLTGEEHAGAVQQAIHETLAEARSVPVSAGRLAETCSRLRYAFTGNLDNSGAIASMLAGYVHFERTPETVNALYASYEALTPATVREVANRYFVDARRTTVTLSPGASLAGVDPEASIDALVDPAAAASADEPPPGPAIEALSAAEEADAAPELDLVALPSESSALVDVSFLFATGAAFDPPGKRGLAALTAAMVAEGGSEAYSIDTINAAMYPIASGFSAQVDKEMTRLSGQVHRDNLETWYRLASSQLLTPAFAEADFRRVRTQLVNALRTGLAGNNDEELAKELLYAQIYGDAHPYGWPNGGESDDLASLTLADVRDFYRRHYTNANLTVGLSGGYPEDFVERIGRDLARLPAGDANSIAVPPARAVAGNHALIVRKQAPAVAVSFGLPIDVRRGDTDWVALWLLRSWLGEHRSSNGRLYQKLRAARGMNYGNYAYVEYFPRGMFRMQPDTNLGRQSQIFQVWLRPLRSNVDAHFAVRAAVYELGLLIERGMSEQAFEATRSFLSKNVALLTDGQSRRLGYALDSRYYGIGDFGDYVREGLENLTLADVNRVIREQLTTDNLQFVFVARDAADLAARLQDDTPSPIAYDADMPAELLDEDRVIQSLPLPFDGEDVDIVDVAAVFR